MFLSISAEGPGADSLSFVIQKHPARVFERSSTRLFFPVYEPRKASFVVMTEFPEYKLWNADTPDADAYVTSREYALSSLFCRELKSALNTAIAGRYKTPEDKAMADAPMRLIVDLLPFATSLSDEQISGLFRPLGYESFSPETTPGEFAMPIYTVDHSYRHAWMPQKHRVLELALSGKKTVREVLRHLLVLIPVIDNYTHYTELEVLTAELKEHGEGWLESHPMKDFIVKRFLRHSKKLIKAFGADEEKKEGEQELEKRINLGEMRVNWFVETAKSLGARSAVDAGCGNGKLAEALNKAGILEVSAFDCHFKAVQAAGYRLENKAQVFFSSLMYRDDRLKGKDAFCLQEVIEHMPEFQLDRAMELLFKAYRPKWILMSTPNRSYNKVFNMPEGAMRHRDHKFEFDEAEASAFVARWATGNGYEGKILPIGQEYVPPTPKECAEIEARKQGADPASLAQGATAVLERPVVKTDAAPTFGFLFTRID